MKKIMYSLFAAIIALFAVSCGGGGNSPADIQKSIYSQFQKGNYEKGVDIWFDNLDGDDSAQMGGEKAQMVKAFAEKTKEGMEKKGGIKSFEIVEENISEDGESAIVTTKVVYGDGSEDMEKAKFVKVDGKWKLKFGK